MERRPAQAQGWDRYELVVLTKLDDHNKKLENLEKSIDNIQEKIAEMQNELSKEMTELKISNTSLKENTNKKAALLGLLGGLIPVVIGIAIALLSKL